MQLNANSRLMRQNPVPLLAVLALATVICAPLQAQVQLHDSASPAQGQPGLTIVNVTGSGFPSGTILPSAVTVTLAPAPPVVGLTVNTTATRITDILGSLREVAFQIPASLAVTGATPYAVTISGTTTGGTALSSVNGSALLLLPPATVSLNPTSGAPGTTVSVTISGTNAGFVPGSTVARFGPGTSVGGAAEGALGPVTVTGPNAATAQVTIDPNATPGTQQVLVETGSEEIYSTFTIGQPSLLSVNGNTGQQGQQSLSVVVNGQYTDFSKGVSTASFGAGVTVASLTVTSATTATAVLNVALGATPGPRNVSVITGSETVALRNGFTVTASPLVLAACVPASSVGVLLNGKNVTAYVPLGSWDSTSKNIQVVPLEGGTSRAGITTPNVVNSCASNSLTGETVCTANNTDVYLITGSTLDATLTSGATGLASFSGGTCATCGVAINPVTNQAVLEVGLAQQPSSSGIQFLDLSTNTLSPPIYSLSEISEDIQVDPIRQLILSPNESGVYGLFQFGPAGTAQFENRVPVVGGFDNDFDSAAEDCTTGVALTGSETPLGQLFLADLTQATFSGGTWTAPGQIQRFPEFTSLSAGTDGIAVAPGFHLGIVTGEFGGNAFGVFQLPSTSGSGVPAVQDYVAAVMPALPNGMAFEVGLDPHTVTAYTSPSTGKPYGVITGYDGGATYLGLIDLEALLNAPRLPGSPHTLDPAIGLITQGIVTYVSIFPVPPGTPAISIAPNGGLPGQQNLAVNVTGQFTTFTQGKTTLSFSGAGITVVALTINSPTSLTATLNIDLSATSGPRDVVVFSGVGNAPVTLVEGFAVLEGPPALLSVSPNNGSQGQSPTAIIVGESTHFTAQVTTADFGPGITVTSVGVESLNRLAAFLNIDPSAATGPRNVAVTTGSEVVSLPNAFTVQPGIPAITQLTPNQGQQGQSNLSLTITGNPFTQFSSASVVTFSNSGVTAGAPTAATANSVTVPVSIAATAAVGYRSLTVTTAGQSVVSSPGFYVAPGTAVITQVNPSSGQQGQSSVPVTITGNFTSFSSSSVVTFGNPGVTAGAPTAATATSVTVPVSIIAAAGLGTTSVTVTTNGQAVTLNNGFTVNPGTPVITQVNPSSGQQGQSSVPVTITGNFTSFSSSSVVTFGNLGVTAGAPTAATATSVTVPVSITAAAALGTTSLTVTTNSQTVTLNNALTVGPGPVITQVNPNSGQQGQSNVPVTITGNFTSFSSSSVVTFGNPGVTAGAPTAATATSVTVPVTITAAAGLGSTSVTVTTNGQAVALNNGFTVNPGTPVITQVNPSSGQQGQSNVPVTITGNFTSFSSSSVVTFGNLGVMAGLPTAATATSVTVPVSITAAAALGPTGVTVTTNGQAVTLNNGFTVNPGTPVITQVNPSSGQQGQSSVPVTITGNFTSFSSSSVVTFGNLGVTAGAPTAATATSVTVPVSIAAAAALGPTSVTMTTNGQEVTLNNGFTVNPGTPVITQVNPSSGQQGQQNLSVAITGQFTHFAQGTTTANFGPQITASLTVMTPTTATAVLNISGTAGVGSTNVVLQTGTETATLANGFTVLYTAPGQPAYIQTSLSDRVAAPDGSVTATETAFDVNGNPIDNPALQFSLSIAPNGLTTGNAPVISGNSITFPRLIKKLLNQNTAVDPNGLYADGDPTDPNYGKETGGSYVVTVTLAGTPLTATANVTVPPSGTAAITLLAEQYALQLGKVLSEGTTAFQNESAAGIAQTQADLNAIIANSNFSLDVISADNVMAPPNPA